MKIYYSGLLALLSSQSAFAGVEFGRDLRQSNTIVNAKSAKNGKVKQGKTANVAPVDVVFSIDTATINAKSVKTGKVKQSKTMPVDVLSIDTTVSADVFSYGRDSFSFATEAVVASGKTGKVAKAAADVDSESEDVEASAKSIKIVPKVVRAMPTDNINAAGSGLSAENAAVINGAGAVFVVTMVAFGAMMA
ncbi:hypothetical protein ACHAWT_002347 [Skeletonema menzelii]